MSDWTTLMSILQEALVKILLAPMDRAGSSAFMRDWLAGLLAFVVVLLAACGADVAAKSRESVTGFRQAVGTGDPRMISQWVRYPLSRRYPLRPIEDAKDCMARFTELLPAPFLAQVAASSDGDWQQVGFRGVMFDSGRVWLDDQQRMRALNRSSEAEIARRDGIVERDRIALVASLQEYDEPVLRWQTKTYRLRIDRMGDGQLRFTSWRRGSPLDAMPDLELLSGVHEFDGSGGNHHYEWKDGERSYRCVITLLGSYESEPFELEVRRGKEVLQSEAGAVFYPK